MAISLLVVARSFEEASLERDPSYFFLKTASQAVGFEAVAIADNWKSELYVCAKGRAEAGRSLDGSMSLPQYLPRRAWAETIPCDR